MKTNVLIDRGSTGSRGSIDPHFFEWGQVLLSDPALFLPMPNYSDLVFAITTLYI